MKIELKIDEGCVMKLDSVYVVVAIFSILHTQYSVSSMFIECMYSAIHHVKIKDFVGIETAKPNTTSIRYYSVIGPVRYFWGKLNRISIGQN